MKHKAPQLELPGSADVFNLRGGTVKQEAPKPAPAPMLPQLDFSHILNTDPERTHPEIDKP